MSRHAVPTGAAQAFVEARRSRLCHVLGRDPEVDRTAAEVLSPDRLAFFRNEAEDLYWNELVWEELTDEEAITGAGHMTEMVFPGFLAFIGGLLNERAPADSLVPAKPHPDAVEEILLFLGERYVAAGAELEAGADSQKLVWARAMTRDLVDLVLYRLYRLPPLDVERLEAAD